MRSVDEPMFKAISENFLVTNKKGFVTFCADSAPGVPDELPLGHLVLHVGRTQVHGEQDQGEAHHVSDQDDRDHQI